MRRYLKIMFAALFTFAVIAMAAKISFAVDHGHEFIDINSQKEHPDLIKSRDTRWVPHFPHRLHQEKYLHGREKYAHFKYTENWVCSGCHHMSRKGQQPQACLKCKDVKKMLHKVGAKESDGYKKSCNIFHTNCREGCHKGLSKADKARYGFLKKCKTCHKSKPGKPYKYPSLRH